MPIKGVGVDICNISRIEKALANHPQKFSAKILTKQEQSPTHTAREIAKYFAAKEAVAKAFGCGIGAKLSFKDIVIERGLKQPPKAHLVGGAVNGRIHLSLSDEETAVVAFAVVEEENV